jgi:hypothetical protein
VSAYLVIAAAGLASMAGVVVVARRLAYRPAHAATTPRPEPVPAPDVGSMSLADEQHYQRGNSPGLGVRVLHGDPFGVPPAGDWTDELLAELHEAPTVLDLAEPDAFRLALAADAAAHAALLETETRLYLLELADRGRAYLLGLRAGL